MKPIFSVSGVPATMAASRSRPWRSVPNGCSHDGGCKARTDSGRASSVSTVRLPTMMNSASSDSSTMPTASERLRRR